VVTELATEHPPAGLVLRSPFVDLASVGRVHYPFLPVRTLLRHRYPLADLLTSVKVPTTVIYGSRDSIVQPEQSRAVAAAAAGETRVVEIAGVVSSRALPRSAPSRRVNVVLAPNRAS
jgi:pimeloyl-ACP methyl ester carboxylesterase